MSCTTIKAIWPGEKHENFRELSNGWGSAPVIWDALSQRYLGKQPYGYSGGDMQPLWDLWKDASVPESYRAVHLLTLDRMYVLRKDYARMAKDIRAFLAEFPVGVGANHWPAIAEFLESDADIPAMGLRCTSVSEDPFCGEWNEEKGEYDQPDWSTVYDLYAELDSLKEVAVEA